MKKVVLAIVGLNLMASAAVADQTSGAPIKMTEYTCGEFLQGLQLIQNLQKAPSGSQRIVMNFIYALGYFDGQYQAATPAAALTDAQIVKGHKMVAAVCSASRTALFTGATVISVNKLTGK